MTPRFIYVADPMCSWCWGFAPVLAELEDRFALPVDVVVGGLRPGPAAQPLDPPLRSYLAQTWRRISELTGQPFDDAPLDWEEWTYDTELPARAIVTVRAASPGDTTTFFSRVQRAFYSEGVDITDPAAYRALVLPFALDADDFLARLASEESRESAWRDFRRARTMGVTGFPALFLETGGEATAVTLGYRPIEAVAPIVETALAKA